MSNGGDIMIDLGVNLNIDVDLKEVHFPVYFERKNICVSCGESGCLKFINIFGKESSHEVHPFEHIKCSKCGAIYSIKWDKDQETEKLYPSAVDRSMYRDFLNNFKKKENMEKDLK
jgi:hypothetical protein